jgi:hypothetical protein
MISAFVAVAWPLGLIALLVGAALLGRPHSAGEAGQAETYEQSRFTDRNRHARRVREEELDELRRRG